MDVSKELLNHSYRVEHIMFEDLFPYVERDTIMIELASLKKADPHETILNIACEMWNGKYNDLLGKYGFFDKHDPTFTGHCHQCTPALALVLFCLGFIDVAYLECYRIREHFPETGKIEKVPPEEEPNPEMVKEFCNIGRIPYCCLEVKVNGVPYYISAKHIKKQDGTPTALLTEECYADFSGVMKHQKDQSKSGIYLKNVIPKNNPENINFNERIVWMKQTFKDPQPEYFATFLRMEIK